MQRFARHLDPQAWLPSHSRRNILARFDHMGGQERLRKILRIQCHDEIGSASFSATAEGIVSRIGRDPFDPVPEQIGAWILGSDLC